MAWQLDSFSRSLTGAAPGTVEAYGRDVAAFVAWAERGGLRSPDEIDRLLLRRYLAYLATRGYARNTIARKAAAVEKRNGELGIVGVVAIALAQRPRRGTQLQPQVPQFLREAPHRIFESLLGSAISKKKKQIDIGIGEHPSPAEAACGDERKVGGLGVIG